VLPNHAHSCHRWTLDDSGLPRGLDTHMPNALHSMRLVLEVHCIIAPFHSCCRCSVSFLDKLYPCSMYALVVSAELWSLYLLRTRALPLTVPLGIHSTFAMRKAVQRPIKDVTLRCCANVARVPRH